MRLLCYPLWEWKDRPDFQPSLIKREVPNVYFILQQHGLAEMKFFHAFYLLRNACQVPTFHFFFISHPVMESNFSFEHSMLVWV